jgi:hypothetical protein
VYGAAAGSVVDSNPSAGPQDTLAGLIGTIPLPRDRTDRAEDIALELEPVATRRTVREMAMHLALLCGIQLAIEELIEPLLALLAIEHGLPALYP